MRLGQLMGMRLRALPEDVTPEGLAWLIRAGAGQRLANGSMAWLPLGRLALARLADVVRHELENLGGQAVFLNAWSRCSACGQEGALPMPADLLEIGRHHIQTYKALPVLLYQDDTVSLTLAALAESAERLDELRRNVTGALFTAAQRCGLLPVVLEELAGLSFFIPMAGDTVALVCPQCGYRAGQEAARMRKTRPAEEVPRPLQKVATPGASTIAELCAFLGIPPERTAKAVLLMGSWPEGERLVFVVIRGDMEVNLAKVQQVTGARRLRPATEAEIRACGAEPGYASPMGVRGALVVADDLIPYAPNLVAGANEAGYHFINVTYGSDFVADVVADVALAHAGSACPECGAVLEAHQGVRVLRAWEGGAPGGMYQDAGGQMQPWHLALWNLDLEAWLVALAEVYHDAQGLRWPVSVAPYQVHLVVLPGKGNVEVVEQAERLYARLMQSGVPTLLDDRAESAGVKFMDADVLGMPIRVTVSERALKAGGVEVKLRAQAQGEVVPLDEAISYVLRVLQALQAALEAQWVPWVS